MLSLNENTLALGIAGAAMIPAIFSSHLGDRQTVFETHPDHPGIASGERLANLAAFALVAVITVVDFRAGIIVLAFAVFYSVSMNRARLAVR